MKVIIIYSSCDGQTKKIAEFMAKQLSSDTVVTSVLEPVDLSDFSHIVIGASIRYGHFDKNLYQFIENNYSILSQKKSAFFGVNLTARKAGKDNPETNVYIRKFLQRIEWKPMLIGVFAGALLYPRYKWFDRIMIQFIMKLTGGETDTTKEIEYTDWEKVSAFVEHLRTK